jgi:hypothetical protein
VGLEKGWRYPHREEEGQARPGLFTATRRSGAFLIEILRIRFWKPAVFLFLADFQLDAGLCRPILAATSKSPNDLASGRKKGTGPSKVRGED